MDMRAWVAGLAFVVSVALGFHAVFAQEAPPAALSSQKPTQDYIAHNGSYTTSIDLQVPAFRGLEPDLALTYDSSRGIRGVPDFGGWVGTGWDLAGIGVIERIGGAPLESVIVTNSTTGATTTATRQNASVSAGRGAPSNGWRDWFRFGATELVRCAWQDNASFRKQSASCLAGGDYARMTSRTS